MSGERDASLDGKTVVISGASSGIGRATAEAVSDAGGKAVLLARSKSDLESAVSAIRERGGEATAFPVDLSDSSAVGAVADSIIETVGVPDVVVNNAGVGKWRAVDETTVEEAERCIEVPYLAAFYLTKALIDDMLSQDSGRIVNVTSASAYIPQPGATAYNASRWAMRGFTKSLRADLRETGIGVTLVAPGKVDTPYFENNPGSKDRVPKLAESFRTLTPEEVATAIVGGVESGRRNVIVPLELRVALWVYRLFPRPIQWAANATGWSRN